MKRIITLLFAAMLCLSAAAYASGNAAGELAAFGIFSGEDTSAPLTREEAALWLCRAMGLDSEYDRCIFADTETGSRAANAAMALWELGVISGDGGNFRPGQTISYTEFAAMLVNALNYRDMATAYGGYPAGYVRAAGRLGLLKGAAMAEKLTVAQGSQMLANALDTKLLDSDKTMLEHYLGIYKISGRVTADNKTSLTSPEGEAGGKIRIDGKTLAADIAAEEWLGKYVDAFYSETDGGDLLLYIEAEREFKEITLTDADIVREKSDRAAVVYELDGREKKLKISPVADIIYNGKAYPDLPEEAFIPECGTIRALDSRGSGEYDVLFIDSYDLIWVRNTVAASKSIYNKFTGGSFKDKIELTENSDFDIYDSYGEKIGFGEIDINNVVLAAEAQTGSSPYFKLIVSDKMKRGAVSQVSEDKITLADGECDALGAFFGAVSLRLLPELKLGKEYYAYLDPFDRVAAIERVDEGKQYGYLKRAFTDEETDTDHLKIFTQDGIWQTYELREKVKYNGETYDARALTAIIDRGVMTRYETDAKKRIKSIETAQKFSLTDAGLAQKIKSDVFRKSEISSLLNNNKYYSMNKSFQNTFFAEQDAKVFLIPKQSGASDEDFECTDLGYFTSESRYTADVYDFDKYMFSRLFVVEYDSSKSDWLSSSLGDSDYCMMVDRAYTAVVDGGCVSVVRGLLKGELWSYTSTEPDTFKGLRRGDIIRTKYDASGKLRQYVPVYMLSDGELKSSVSDVNNAKYIYGRALAVDYEKRRMRLDEGNELTVIAPENAVVCVYDEPMGEVRSGSLQDIAEGDYIVLRMRTSVPYEIFVIKK